MAAKRGTSSAAGQGEEGLGILSTLDEGSLTGVLRAAHGARVLTSLASSSRQLCTLVRSGVPFRLNVWDSYRAQLVLLSHARGRPPFSGCTYLHLAAHNPDVYNLAGGVLGTAQHWTALQELVLDLGTGRFAAFRASALLSHLPALKQLRRLDLNLSHLRPCSIGHIGHLVQLTGLQLGMRYGAAAAARTRLDLAAWSGLTNLKDLVVEYMSAAPQPAASALGPFCLPSSLTSLALRFGEEFQEEEEEEVEVEIVCYDAMACLLTHLPGCPQLQQLEIRYSPWQHASTHPHAVVSLLAQHNRSLRKLDLMRDNGPPPFWGAAVEGLPDAAAPVGGAWHPGAALAALTGLEVLHTRNLLTIAAEQDWQHMAQLTALTQLDWVVFQHAPPLQARTCLGVLHRLDCNVALSGHDLGRLLLACPQLHTALLTITSPLVATPVDPSGGQLQPHPRLKTLQLAACQSWSSPAATAAAPPPPGAAAPAAPAAPAAAAAGAAAHLDALAPVLKGLLSLTLRDWPAGSSGSSSGSSSGGDASRSLPDLSRYTALTELKFCCERVYTPVPPEQEAFLSMLAPLVQLQVLRVEDAPRLNARAMLVLQGMLPQLRSVTLFDCGKRLLLAPAGSSEQQEQQALDGVKQLLRPGLQLQVGEFKWGKVC